MEDTIAVSVKNVSKKFLLFGSPKDRLLEALHPFKRKYHREFWALKDISFEVPKGTTLGIVGRNGSGKSTLLQIICSVLKPTLGTVTVNSRVSALLELGAGFNHEFTGRDNVILNGALMGFTRREMEERLPLIESFADIGEFIDQPVKTYSSGMFVRLAFAAAINVDPDILIVDEALAVGDAKFQHKCYNKFLEFQNAGKTILFVSHSTDAIVRHCDYAILLDGGRIVEKGEPKTIINYYMDLLFTGKITGYASSPVLCLESYQGFNIVHYGAKYYAFSQSLGRIDLNCPIEDKLNGFMGEGKCLVGTSLEEVKQLVGRITLSNTNSAVQIATGPAEKEKTELERFIEGVPETDNCVNRRSYNKNEYRYGDKRAEIIDYLIVAGNRYDPVTINSGDVVDIYVKHKFHEDMVSPMFGFAVKTVDGVIIYGNNTRLGRIVVPPVHKNNIIVIKWTFKLISNNGDLFLNLGVAEKQLEIDVPIDNRKDIIHLHIQILVDFTGLVNFKASYQEISREALEVVS
jgi:ABC-type polysaccharide/polyol phosphate transport system ATPase subunit